MGEERKWKTEEKREGRHQRGLPTNSGIIDNGGDEHEVAIYINRERERERERGRDEGVVADGMTSSIGWQWLTNSESGIYMMVVRIMEENVGIYQQYIVYRRSSTWCFVEIYRRGEKSQNNSKISLINWRYIGKRR